MTTRYVIGVDVGTSSTKGVLVTLAGEVEHTVTRSHEPRRPRPGHVEMDGGLWWDEFVDVARELVAAAEGTIVAAGVSGMGPCALLTDEDGAPLRPAILYGVDTRATSQIAALEAELGAEEIRRSAGSSLTSQATGPKIAWVADNEPDVFERARRVFMPASWLAWNLTGAYVIDHHSASQMVPLYDPVAQDWRTDWAERICGDITLPRLGWAGDTAGQVTAEAARTTGLPDGIPVIFGSIDAWTEAVSVGADKPGDFLIMYGTTIILIATSEQQLTHPQLWGTLGTANDTYCLAGGTATSGAVTNWLRDIYGESDYTRLVAEAAESPAGSRGLLMLPYFAGERTPINDPDVRGGILGLTLSHTRADIYRAALEATAYAIRHNLEAMREGGAEVTVSHAAGGGASSTLWPQIVSDVTGLPQLIASNTIGASLGAAFLAAATVADVDIRDWNPIVNEIRPNPENAIRYDRLYADYREFADATRSLAHRLAALQLES